ncbi:MAG: hypothetical protein QOD49_1084, partial [Actinomycetota bacterium]|nr:hypothetical protein [Actinomycetota bacterium]
MLTTPRRRLACVLLAAGMLVAACTGRKQLATPSPSVPSTATGTAGDAASPTATATGSSPSAGAASPGGASVPAPPTLTWRPCTPGAFQCSTIAVPLDWSHPSS